MLSSRINCVRATLAAQQRGSDECAELKTLIMDFLEVSLLDTVFYASTAGSSRGKGGPFYKTVLSENKVVPEP